MQPWPLSRALGEGTGTCRRVEIRYCCAAADKMDFHLIFNI